MPVIAAIGALWAQLGGIYIGTFAAGAAVQSLIIATALNSAASAIFKTGQGSSNYNAGLKLNNADNSASISVLYGTRELGGTEIYRGVSGENNKYFHRIMVIAEGEIDGIEAVYYNDTDVDEEDTFDGLINYTFHSGTDDQAADEDMVRDIADWTEAHTVSGVAYIYMRTEYSAAAFPTGMPTLTVKVRGRKVYDPRNDTVAFSNNPALCLRDYLTNSRFGAGIDAGLIVDDSFIEEANYCDELVTFKDEEDEEYQEARYAVNGVLDPDNGFYDNIQRLLLTCRGMLIFTAGRYKLVIDKPGVADFDFNEDNITGAWGFANVSKSDILNQVRVRFFDAALRWEESLTVVSDPEYKEQDFDRVFEQDLTYPLTDSLARAYILGQHHIKQSRQGLTVSFTSTLEALVVDVGDLITVTHKTPGWDAKLFRVQRLVLEASDTIQVELSEYDPSVYTHDIISPPTIPDTNLPGPFDRPLPRNLALESGTEHLLIAGDGTVISRLYVTWEAPASSFVVEYEVAYRAQAGSWTAYKTSERAHYFTPVRDGSLYDVRVRAIYAVGLYSEYLSVTGYAVIGKTAAPSAPVGFSFASQRDYTREFSWTLNSVDRDIQGYQIRYSTVLADEWDSMTPLHDGELVSSPWETNVLNAGTYRFAIKSMDTSGNESEFARYITATLSDSPTSSIFYARYARNEGWPGILTGFISNTGDLESNDSTSWDDLDSMAWDDWETWGVDGDDLVYQFEDIDLNAVLTFRPVISVQAQGVVTYAVDCSEDNVQWTGWTLPVGDVTARYLRVRITVAHTEARVNSMSILLDGAQESEDFPDLDTATLGLPAGDFRVPLIRTFVTIKTVTVALQNTGPGWSWEVIDKDAVLGPRIKIYDNTGTLADAIVDVTVKGY